MIMLSVTCMKHCNILVMEQLRRPNVYLCIFMFVLIWHQGTVKFAVLLAEPTSNF